MKVLLRYAELLALGIALEASAYPKPGNVHRFRDFVDTMYEDFVITAIVAVEPLYRGIVRGYRYGEKLDDLEIVYGDIIYELILSSKRVSGGGNTCLGTSIMLAPIAIVLGLELSKSSEVNVTQILDKASKYLERFSTPMDTVYLYKAIRVAKPSYIRRTDETKSFPNVWSEDFKDRIISEGIKLWDVMKFSSLFDLIAKEVVEGYPRVRETIDYISKRLRVHNIWNKAIVESYLYRLSKDLDTLVIRKNGYNVALYVNRRASEILRLCEESWDKCEDLLWEFDRELAKKNVNPGSTADIIATTISIYAIKKRKGIIRLTTSKH